MSKKKLNSPITTEEIRDALLRSGYPLEVRVSQILREYEFSVIPNRRYQDPITSKTRELDVYAWLGNSTPGLEVNVSHTFLIECVNNSNPVIFFQDQPGYEDDGTSKIPTNYSDPIKIEDQKNRTTDIPSIVNLHEDEYRFNLPVSRQYCSFEKKNDKWIATHESAHHESFEKLSLNVDEHFKDLSHIRNDKRLTLDICYAVLILQGPLRIASIEKKISDINLSACQYALYAQEGVIHGEYGSFSIDIITADFLPKFCEHIIDNQANYFSKLRGYIDK